MPLLGKVFIYMIFVLSIVFFTTSVLVNSTHINNKEAAEKASARAALAEEKNTQLGEQLLQLQNELAIERLARRSSLAALQSELTSLQADLEQKEKNFIQKTAQVTQLSQSEKVTTAELKARTAENDLLRKQIREAEDNISNILAKYVETKDAMNRLAGNYETLKSRAAQATDDYTAALSQLDILGIDERTPLVAPPAGVNGQVLAVASNGLVEVSLGRDDGMREGFTLEVTRGGQYLGRVRVTNVRDDKSVAEILTGFRRGAILQGDRVDSKLY